MSILNSENSFMISFPSDPEWHISNKTSISMQFKSSDIMHSKEIGESVVVIGMN